MALLLYFVCFYLREELRVFVC